MPFKYNHTVTTLCIILEHQACHQRFIAAFSSKHLSKYKYRFIESLSMGFYSSNYYIFK